MDKPTKNTAKPNKFLKMLPTFDGKVNGIVIESGVAALPGVLDGIRRAPAAQAGIVIAEGRLIQIAVCV